MARQLHSRSVEKFLVGFDGARLPPAVAALLEQGLAGVALYPRNFDSLKSLRALTDEIQAAARRGGHPPALIGVDQEGGSRFAWPSPFTAWPSATELGRLDDPASVEQVAAAMAGELRAAGVNLDFAPVLDLHLQPHSPVTLDRSFGSAPLRVARLGAAFLRGLAAGGVLGCAKHFPGHGDTRLDPHHDLPRFDASLDRLLQVELVPFAAAVVEGASSVMTAHILLPAIDPDRPASLSPVVLREILRGRLGYQGVILADDLGMGAIRKFRQPAQAAVESFAAGTDIAMLCHDWSLVEPAMQGVTRACADGQLSPLELQASQARIARLRASLTAGADSPSGAEIVGCARHLKLAAELRARISRTCA